MPHRRKIGSSHTFRDGRYHCCAIAMGVTARDDVLGVLRQRAPAGTLFRYISNGNIFYIYTREAHQKEETE